MRDETLTDILHHLQQDRDRLVALLNLMYVHAAETHQLDSALKAIDTAAGLIKGVLAE